MSEEKMASLSSEELENVNGGIRLSPEGMDVYYRCPDCGGDDFYVIGLNGMNVSLRCKRCSNVCLAPQNY